MSVLEICKDLHIARVACRLGSEKAVDSDQYFLDQSIDAVVWRSRHCRRALYRQCSCDNLYDLARVISTGDVKVRK